MSQIRIVKRKARGFFKPDDISTIKETVTDCHNIISAASILVRAFYLDWFQTVHPISDDVLPLEISKDHVAIACSIVQGATTAPIRSTSKSVDDKVQTFQTMLGVYESLYDRLETLPKHASKYSLSHILSYSQENLLTAYENNIHAHFPKYPKRYILCDLLSKGVDRKVAKRTAAIVTNHFLYDAPIEETQQPDLVKIGFSPNNYTFLFPKKLTITTEKRLCRAWDLKVHPWHYLYKMVMINQALETEFPQVKDTFRKLLNPLPFHSSFVPMHVRFDTSGLAQLLMEKDRIVEFKKLYELEHPEKTLNMKNKSDMLSSYKKLFGKDASSREEEGLYATDMWAFLTNLKTCRQWKEVDGVVRKKEPNRTWVFDNAVVTDGVSVSFQVINKSMFGRKTLTGRKKVGERFGDVADPKQQDCVPLDDKTKYKILGNDPGKRDLAAVTDGYRTITYTKGQRDQDTYFKARTHHSMKKRKKTGVDLIESQVLNRTSKNSCHLFLFKRYACVRERHAQRFQDCYSHPMFREFKFLFHCQKKSSEDKFIDRVKKTFTSPNAKPVGSCTFPMMVQNASKDASQCNGLLIGWGNWGKAPNAIKGVGSTPGIGLRRSFERIFKTETVDESFSSQTCPCCKGERCLKKVIIGSNPEERHHLLRCENEHCHSRWWNRNVAGAVNILSRILKSTYHLLPLGTNLPGAGNPEEDPSGASNLESIRSAIEKPCANRVSQE